MIFETSATLHTEKGEKEVRYFVTKPVLPEDCTVPCYGVGISDGETKHFISALLPDKEETVNLIKRICKGQVTPVTFREILEDYLAERA